MWAPLVTPHHHVGSTGYPPPQRGLHRLRPSPTRASRVNPPFSSELHRLPPTPTWAPQVTPLPQVGSTDFPPTPTLTRAFCHFHPLMRFLYSFNISLLVAQIYIARGVFTIVFLSQVPPNQTVRDSHPLSTDFYSRKNKRCQLLDQRLTCHDNQVGSRDISVEINVSSAKWTYLVLSANLSQSLSRF